MPTYRFSELKRSVAKRVPCEVCGKKLARSSTFSQTLNPFNRLPDGTPKTAKDIYAELDARAAEWRADQTGEQHAACASSAQADTDA